ncbi:tetratricopeptide repeat protein [Lacipirellula sp.]|uniref:tetratricopeptide repeat protein n=1 Tax=Lacipirellula sp. TaxID=2691419 RepID=UPI003D14BD1E
MRKFWFANCMLAVAALGCSSTNGPGVSGGYVSKGGPPGAPGAVIAEAGWTDKFVASMKEYSPSMFGDSKPNAVAPAAPSSDVPFDPKKATPELHVSLAHFAHRAGQIPQARQHYQKALAMDPKNLDALLGAARLEDREGRLDVAQMLYERAAKAHPQSATAQNDLALCYARRGDLPTAARVLDQAVRLEPRKALYRNNSAKVLVEMNQVKPAMDHLMAVHTPAVANYNMAVLLNDRGRSAEAMPFLSQAISLDPAMQPAHEMLAQLTAPVTPQYEHSIVAQQQPAMPAPAAYGEESILPTPEAVAAMPNTPWIAPAAATQSVDSAPMLLPPVNQ